MARRNCFFIAPIGDDGSPARERSDKVFKHIIARVAEKLDYEAIRADRIAEPGIITSQVIEHLLQDEIVIADLTDQNPNVFYELALRHAIHRPVFQIIEKGQKIPFDIAQSRTIQYDLRDLDSVADCQEELLSQIRSVEDNPDNFETPFSIVVDLQTMRRSENPQEQTNAEFLELLHEIRGAIKQAGSKQISAADHDQIRDYITRTLNRINRAIASLSSSNTSWEVIYEQLMSVESVLAELGLKLVVHQC